MELRDTVALNDLIKAMASTLDFDAILSKVADVALQQCRADEVSIMLPVDEAEELYIAAVRGRHREHILGERVPIGGGIAGWVARHHEPLVLNGEVNDPRFAPLNPRAEIRTAISIPMLAGGRLIGVLNVNATHARRPFTLDDLKALHIIVSTAAPTLEGVRLSRQAREAEEKYRAIFENAIEGIFQSTPAGCLVTANPALARIYGYESPEQLMQAVRDLAQRPHVDPHRQAELIRLLEAHDTVFGFEAQVYRKDGRVIWISKNVRAIRDTNGKLLGYEGSVEDITRRQHLEDQLRQAQKMEAIGRLAGGISHDFNNVLTIIYGYSKLLLDHLDCNESLYQYATEINKAVNRGTSLSRQLLAFSRKQTLQPKLLSPNAIVSDMDKMLHRLIGEDIELVTVLDPAVGQVSADPGQLEQVIINLVINARDAMPQGGTLTIETANVTLDEADALEQIGVRPGPYVRLTVRDTGCGMDAETKAHLFEPFFTTKGPGKGTGLGLATAYGIITQSGGHIKVDSAPGQGATFMIYLPQVVDLPKPVPSGTSRPELPRGTETLLLVEDETGVRTMVCETLLGVGYTVLEAQDTQEALRICEQREGVIHLLLSDVVMPRMSGPALAERLTALRPTIRVLYMSGYSEEAIARYGPLHPDAALLQKPFTLEALARKVREVLDSDPVQTQ